MNESQNAVVSVDLRPRCGKCPQCQRVAEVKTQAFRALAQADVRRANSLPAHPVGDDVRLIWNQTLAENPCSPMEEV